jgi:hypothetical protein
MRPPLVEWVSISAYLVPAFPDHSNVPPVCGFCVFQRIGRVHIPATTGMTVARDGSQHMTRLIDGAALSVLLDKHLAVSCLFHVAV